MRRSFLAVLFAGAWIGPAAACAADGPAFARADDWVTTGTDCEAFAIGDVDGDGVGDVVTVNGPRSLCVAFSVAGDGTLWKASGWEVLRDGVPSGETGLLVGDVVAEWEGNEVAVRIGDRWIAYGLREKGRFTQEREVPAPPTPSITLEPVDPPPYEPSARAIATIVGDLDGDGRIDRATVFDATTPVPHRVLRVAVALRDDGDADGDGAPDARERDLGSDPHDRDTDDDGLLDGWEINGLPRGITGFDGTLDPRRQDVLVAVARYEQLDEAVAKREVERAKGIYARLTNANPDGTSGITMHVRWDEPVPQDAQGSWSWWEVGNRRFPSRERGIAHWMQITPGGGGQAQQTGDMGGSGAHWAAFAHELGHQLSLSHEGDSIPAWCPLYPSFMNYAFNYSLGGDPEAIGFSPGRFRNVELRETALEERLPFPFETVKYLAAPPFRFTLEDAGDGTTKIDWDHDGHFDEGLVAADINYGGSTHAGVRRTVELSASAPALGVAAGGTWLALVDPKTSAVTLRRCEGDGRWSTPRVVPASSTRDDPIVVGDADAGFVLFRTQRAWCVSRFTAETIDAPIELPELSTCDLSAVGVGDRILLVTRGDDDRLATAWFRPAPAEGEPRLTPSVALDLTSRVPPGLAVEPNTSRLVIATSATNPAGHAWCLRATWCSLDGDTVRVDESRWTRGASNVNHCTTRPVVAFRAMADGNELNIFHTGWLDANGLTTAWRTKRVGNAALDDGWLTCLLYDVWTLTRVGVAFVDGPQGAIYAYRWDPGDHGEVKVTMVQTAHNGWGIDADPMRDFDDAAKIGRWGIRHSILWMRR
jgi:hypothetical protein